MRNLKLQNWWQGEWLNDQELSAKLAELNMAIQKGIQEPFDLDQFLQCCDQFSKKIQDQEEIRNPLLNKLISSEECSPDEAKEVLDSIAQFLTESEMRKKLMRELGTDKPFSSTRVDFKTPIFESYKALGFVVQIMPGNDPALPVLSTIEGLLTGNVNFVKMSRHSSEFTAEFFAQLFSEDSAKVISKRLIVAKIPSYEKEKLKGLFQQADAVVAWGGEEAITEIKNLCPAHVKFIEWGHRISFAYVSANCKSQDGYIENLVKDILLFNQQACSSPQSIYIEDASFSELKIIAEKIHRELEKQSAHQQLTEPSPMEAAEIQKVTLVVEVEKSFKENYTEVIKDKEEKSRWRLLVDMRPGLRASPLYRTLWIKPIHRKQIWEVFRPLRQYLQTVGLEASLGELKELSETFYQVGIHRVRPIGKMQESYMGEPHDGYLALNRYLRKVSLESDIPDLQHFATLDDLAKTELKFLSLPDKIMTKSDFQKQNVPEKSELYFKSGGSSGEPKISYFTYHDYHHQMALAAQGLIAAGLNPGTDRCMNLFFAGGLYGGFLSFYTILEKINAIQLPMAAHMDFTFVGETIVKNKVNVILGMPSYLMLMFEANKELFKANQIIEKIYFGGEHFSELQRKKLMSDYGVKVIHSASYGSVDMGPLGYQCLHSPTRVHHLHQSLHSLEILKLDKDLPVEGNETGRLVFSTNGREGQKLLRYEIGDVGRWIIEPCACGRKSPRFELLGRTGDIFRAAGCFYSYNRFQQILSDFLNYDKEFQLVIDNETGLDRLTLRIDKSTMISEEQVFQALIENYKDLDETVHEEKVMKLKFEFVENKDFYRSSGSGKLLHVNDKRIISEGV